MSKVTSFIIADAFEIGGGRVLISNWPFWTFFLLCNSKRQKFSLLVGG